MDHVLETLETDLKYTVFLICEEVVDLHLPDEEQKKECEGTAAPATTDAPTTTDAQEARKVSDIRTLPFLSGTDEDWYQFRCQLSEGDSIPRCDATLLRMPVSKRDMEKEKKAAKKSVKMKIKKFKKLTGGNVVSHQCRIGSAVAAMLICLAFRHARKRQAHRRVLRPIAARA